MSDRPVIPQVINQKGDSLLNIIGQFPDIFQNSLLDDNTVFHANTCNQKLITCQVFETGSLLLRIVSNNRNEPWGTVVSAPFTFKTVRIFFDHFAQNFIAKILNLL